MHYILHMYNYMYNLHYAHTREPYIEHTELLHEVCPAISCRFHEQLSQTTKQPCPLLSFLLQQVIALVR